MDSKKKHTSSTVATLILFSVIVLALILADLIRKTYEAFFFQKLGVPQGKFKWLAIMMIITAAIFVVVLIFVNKYQTDVNTQDIILGAL